MNIGLIFGMIVAIIVMVAVFVFGYDYLNNLTRIQNEAEIKKAVDRLTTSVDRVYSLGGESSEKHSMSFPSEVTSVCFFPKYRGMMYDNVLYYDRNNIITDIRMLEKIGNNLEGRK